MTEIENPSKAQRLRRFVHHMWSDQVAANRALLRPPPYDDYLLNRRGHGR